MSKILLIEDDSLLSRMYEKSFKLEGIEVNTAEDGEEGYNKVLELMPDVVLLDIMMPVKNGLEVLDCIKNNESTKDIPVIILTNLAGHRDAELALSKGAVKYIIKSEHTPGEVVKMIKEILSGYTRDAIPSAS